MLSLRSPVAVAIVGGNCNNGAKCGRYVNVNNVAGNARWNIGPAHLIPFTPSFGRYNVRIFPQPMLKMNPLRGAASKWNTAHRRGGNKKGSNLLKSYNGLFDAMTEHAEIVASIEEAAKRKKKRRVVQWALANADMLADEISDLIRGGTWKPPVHQSHTLQEGSHKKKRDIVKPRWCNEQIVHHMLMRQFAKIYLPKMYHYACGSIVDRGPHWAMRTMRRWRDGYKGRKFYVAELDIRKFYQNVDHGILKRKLERFIRDKRYLQVLFSIIDANPEGLPLGFYTSPFLGMFYLTEFDNYVVQVLRPDHYLRYMDNLYLFHTNKKALHRMVDAVRAYMSDELKLTIKDDWQIFRFEGENRRAGKVTGRAINALGFVIHRNRATIRKSILKRIRAKANRIHRFHRCTRHDAAAMLSQAGWFRHADAYGYFQTWIKPNVSMRYCRHRVSAAAKKG